MNDSDRFPPSVRMLVCPSVTYVLWLNIRHIRGSVIVRTPLDSAMTSWDTVLISSDRSVTSQ